jgi:membrane protease YdiL (CAAX protease family)
LTENPLPEPQPAIGAVLPAPPRDPAWNGWDVVMIVVVALLGLFIFGSVISLALMLAHYRVTPNSPATLKVMLLAQFLSYIVVLVFMRELVVRHYRRDFLSAVYWRWPGEHRWLAYLVGGIALAILVQFLSLLLPIPRTLPIDRYLQNPGAAYLMSIFGISMAPLVEELFFRGFLYPVLARRWGMVSGVVFTALGFALVHASQLAHAWAPLLILFIVGLVFTLARVVTRNVAPGFLMHVGYNFTLFGLLYIATDHFRHMERMLQ